MVAGRLAEFWRCVRGVDPQPIAPEDKETKLFDATHLRRVVRESLPVGYKMAIEHKVMDGRYYAPTPSYWRDVVRADFTNRFAYEEDVHDCEDFCYLFLGRCGLDYGFNTAGLVDDRSAGHAYVVVVLADESVIWYEPQTDAEVEPDPSSNGDYQLRAGTIRI